MKLISISLLAAVGLLWADAPKPPTITDALKAQFFQAQASMIAANAAAQAKRQAFTDVLQQVNKACGEGFQATTDGDDNLSCVVAQKMPAPAVGPKRP